MIMRLLALCVFLWPLSAAAAPEAAVDLSQDFIPVTEDFDGANLMIFGALRRASSDIVIVLEGPAVKAVVRPKVRRFGVWVNEEAQTITDVPSFYAVLSSRPVAKIASRSFVQKNGFSLAGLAPQGTYAEGFRSSRVAKGLYLQIEDGVRIRDKKLFRADVKLPPNVPVGSYKASIYEISGGSVVANRSTTFKIEQIGVNGLIKQMAHRQPVLYAIMCLVLTLAIGGLAARIFRKVSKK